MVSLGARFGTLRYIVSGEGTDLTMIGVIANAQVVELADTGDLKSPGQMRLCGFESRPGHFYRTKIASLDRFSLLW